MSTSIVDPGSMRVPSGTSAHAGHHVDFYGQDAQIVRRVADFLAPGLGSGEAAVVIATEPHRVALEAELAARGLDVARARGRGQLAVLDAATVLSRFLIDGEPDRARFEQVVRETLLQARDGGRTVRVYGEMVAVLWIAGRPRSAIALEKMWNELAKKLSFSLLCGYPISAFSPTQVDEIREVGLEHADSDQRTALA